MKTINFYQYAFNAIKESIKAIDKETAIEYYGDPSECTIESYFGSQINEGKVYDSTQEFIEDDLIGSIDDLRNDFKLAREDAYQEWLNELDND